MAKFCPLGLIGVINGIYYYQGEECPSCNSGIVSTDREHDTSSGKCPGCGGNSDGCQDPIDI